MLTTSIGRVDDYGRRDAADSVRSGKIKNLGLVDKVVHRIGRDIVTGVFKPTATLPTESALCEELGVSRSVLREAVRVLVSKGLLDRKSRLGTRVCPAETWDLLDSDMLGWLSMAEPRDRFVRELFGLRRAVEPAIASLAAECMSEADIKELGDCHRDMIAAGDDVDRFFKPDLRFHQIILRSVDNSLVRALGRIIMQALEINLRLSLAAPLGQQRSVPQHLAVLEAIRERNPEAAREATIRLINEAEEDVWNALAVGRKERDRGRRLQHKVPASDASTPQSDRRRAR